MPLLERVRLQVYVPDVLSFEYQQLFTVSRRGVTIAAYVRELKSAVLEALPEEDVLIAVEQVTTRSNRN